MATFTVTESGNPTTNGQNLQGFVNQATYGDTIIINSGVKCLFTAPNPLLIPNAAGAPGFPAGDARNYITIQSSGLANLPQPSPTDPTVGRIFTTAPTTASDPGVPANMARISFSNATNQNNFFGGAHVLLTRPNAKYWKFSGLEFCPLNANDPLLGIQYFMVIGNFDDNSYSWGGPVGQPDFIFLDRCYVHAWDMQMISQGVILQTLHATVSGCWIDNIVTLPTFPPPNTASLGGKESHALWVIGDGPYTITNNYIASVTESLFIGWGDPNSGTFAGRTGAASIVNYNTITKRTQWLEGFPNFLPGSAWPSRYFVEFSGAGTYFPKNLLEIKTGSHITFDRNFFQYSNNVGDQHGSCFSINLIAYDGSSAIEACDGVAFTNNRIDSCVSAFWQSTSINESNIHNPPFGMVVKNFTASNNLCTNMCLPVLLRQAEPHSSLWYNLFYTPSSGPTQNITFDHNTFIFAPGASAGSLASTIEWSDVPSTTVYQTTSQGVVFTNNIVAHGVKGYAIGLNGFSSQAQTSNDNLSNLQTVWPGATVQKNVSYGTTVDPWPGNNTPASSIAAVGFVNSGGDLTPANWALAGSSPYKNQATDGVTDPGVDVAKLAAVPIGPPPVQIATTTTINPPLSTFPSEISVTVNVAPASGTTKPTGHVHLNLDGQSAGLTQMDQNGNAVFTFVWLPVGTHALVAMYQGDTNFLASTSQNTSLTVQGASSAIQVQPFPNPDTSPGNVTVTVQVN